MSRYDGSDTYVYPGSEVLRNKADLRDQAALDEFEADITAMRMAELLNHPIQGKFDLQHLCAMHRHLFQDVYDWAGQIRTVDISRGASRFANFNQIETYLTGQLNGIAKEKFLEGLKPDAFVSRLTHYLGEINAAHPFREGNGRVQRLFCAQLAEQAGYFIVFEIVDQAKMYEVMIASFNGNNQPLNNLLNDIT
ncbi:MAG: Fic family protein, partial [Rhodoferax sp.]|nr:Fic family protein [Rhodoferax sp.]